MGVIINKFLPKSLDVFVLFTYFSVICFTSVSFGHDSGASSEGTITNGSPVHQKITKEAGNVWTDLPNEIRAFLQNPISSNIHRLCEARYELGFDMVSASADEDQEWGVPPITYCSGNILIPFGPPLGNGFFEHFFDPDQPNFGGSGAYNKGLSDVSDPLGIFTGKQFWSSYRKAEEFWNKRVICYYTGRDKQGNTCTIDKNQAYYWLGRIVHFLEDLAVPAHVHNVQHDPFADAFLGGKDPFEDYVEEAFFTRPSLFQGGNYQSLGPYKGSWANGIKLGRTHALFYGVRGC
jgi:hypothetical protein